MINILTSLFFRDMLKLFLIFFKLISNFVETNINLVKINIIFYIFNIYIYIYSFQIFYLNSFVLSPTIDDKRKCYFNGGIFI